MDIDSTVVKTYRGCLKKLTQKKLDKPYAGIETSFDIGFVARLTAEEKQIQQNYRPVIGVHKWFARRPGALFRSLLLAEFSNGESLATKYFESHSLDGLTIADPFMGGGTTLFEANRVGCNVVGFDINPMAYWIVRQELVAVDRSALRKAAEAVIADIESATAELYTTDCRKCGNRAVVKYFLWVKQQTCGGCGNDLDLWPGYLVAENSRHTHFVLHCPGCRELIEVKDLAANGQSTKCSKCTHRFDWRRGTAFRNRYTCPTCNHEGRYPAELRETGAPRHRLFGLEYYCGSCKSSHQGRFFKTADTQDLARMERAKKMLRNDITMELPEDEIPDGDETKRLHRWGYRKFREMFNERQLLSLGLLMRRIKEVEDNEIRHALATIFSDTLRYQNMLARYDVYALKCQDIFSVHGFPVGLVQCENNVIGIPKIGSGSYRHFVEKYDRAKAYCEQPFETVRDKGKKSIRPIVGEQIDAKLVKRTDQLKGSRKALIAAGSIENVTFAEGKFDAVFTDPPYFDNVQYAELMNFCYAWLRILLKDEFKEFRARDTGSERELTGNVTTGKDLAHFTEGLSRVFSAAAKGLKRGGPFVFTYHHNDVQAYVPLVVALLDAGLVCTATLPCPAEMTASLHINGTDSSVIDTVIVCRRGIDVPKNWKAGSRQLRQWITFDKTELARGGIECTRGDLYCLVMGHLSRVTIAALVTRWKPDASITEKMNIVTESLNGAVDASDVEAMVSEVLLTPVVKPSSGRARVVLQGSLFD